MLRHTGLTNLGTTLLLCCLLFSNAHCHRALVVTSDQYDTPFVTTPYGGLYAATDLTAAGLPFDIRTYSRFVASDLSSYDVIVLNGHTSPMPVESVAQKCEEAIAAGKKVFVNGRMPLRRYDLAGNLIEELFYTERLFGATEGPYRQVTGVPALPTSLEKAPFLTAIGVRDTYVGSFELAAPMPVEITLSGQLIGFLGPTGGALRGSREYEHNLLDYGKLVNYLRHGDPVIVGFANDRIEGQPIASWEVHCHTPDAPSAVDALVSLAERYDIPLDCLLLCNRITPEAAAHWNSIATPLVAKGSHSQTHPDYWPSVPDVLYESTEAIEDQRLLIPSTINFFNFSGNMNPTYQQMDEIYGAGTLFGASGSHVRRCPTPDGVYLPYQLMPTNVWWLKNLAKCDLTPTWPSRNLRSDYEAWTHGWDYADLVAEQYLQNIKYGMYTYGGFHDTYLDPDTSKYVNGIPMGVYIERAVKWVHDQGARFVFTHELVQRLQDYIAGDIDYTSNPDGSATATVSRPGALVNEIKVGFKGDLTPSASGASVLSEHLAGECLYVTLRAETTSTVHVQWSLRPPVAPVIESPTAYISNASEARWMMPVHPAGIAEYQYAVGTTPEGTDAQAWTSAGSAAAVPLSQAILEHGRTYYVSVTARYAGSSWGDAGVSAPLVADLTRAARPSVVDDGAVQMSTSSLHAVWTAEDPESGIEEYVYAIGTDPAGNDVVDWTATTASEIARTDLQLSAGHTYYISVKARNGASLWSRVGTSDGILVQPVSVSVGEARGCPDGWPVCLAGNVVTAVFTGEFYIESPDRPAGIKVVSSAGVCEGDVVDVGGIVARDGVERAVTDAWVSVTGTGSVRPLLMTNQALGGRPSDLMPGPTGGTGLNNVALLVKTWGRIADVGTDYIVIDDGSLRDYAGVKVILVGPHSLRVGAQVLVTGISTLEADHEELKRLVRTRRSSDVAVLLP